MRRVSPQWHRHPRLPLLLAIAAQLLVLCVLASSATAAPAGPAWTIRSLAQPTIFSAASNAACEAQRRQACDSYTLLITNVGSEPANRGGSTPITISDTLPAGVAVRSNGGIPLESEDLSTQDSLSCATPSPQEALLQCMDTAEVPVGDTLRVTVEVIVSPGFSGPLVNSASVAGGGAPAAATQEETSIGTVPAAFGIKDFSLLPLDAGGGPEVQAGGHPYSLTTSFDLDTDILPTLTTHPPVPEYSYVPAEEAKDLVVDLPLGLIGDPAVTPQCPLNALLLNSGTQHCPPASRIGTLVFDAFPAIFRASEGHDSETTAVYNMQPEAGYPAEFGFTYLGKPILMYGSLIRLASGYDLRVTVTGIPRVHMIGASLTFFGEPALRDGGGSSTTPFFTNPVDCALSESQSMELESARLEVDTWQRPGQYHSAQTLVYPQLTECDALRFGPTLTIHPDTTQADEPSGYNFEFGIPQPESEFGETPGAPELKDVAVTLPPGVSASPAVAEGLVACPATGPEGINLGSDEVTPDGEDRGDTAASELGAGLEGEQPSPYDDDLYHIAPGHCPAASTLATVEISTPLLPLPLEGHVYLAQPGCGGPGQAPCGEADAADGKLVSLYLEAAGSGVIVKLAGAVSINPSTGQLTATFKENPQLPFSKLTLHFKGGARAALANPQACGVATTLADLSAWSSPFTPDATLSPTFDVDWDGAGGTCPNAVPFDPELVGTGTIVPSAGAFSPFTLTLTRGDRQQYLSQLSVHMPPGLLGMLSNVALCGEPQAAQGTCSAASEIGTTTVAAGAGTHPFWISGHVYLTGGYRGAPFGLSVVVPAIAGPFNLGTVVVRAAINVDPETGAITITSDPLPQIIDGIPLRIQTLNVTVNRQAFIFNPTNCGQQQIAVTAAGAEGAVADPSSPFAARGCGALSFSPSFAVSTQAQTSKAQGASLDVKIAYKPGQANVRSVAVSLPKQLPSRLTTIQKACLAATFAVNPAACPAQSLIGIAKARTPVLPVLLTGPAYLVSYGNAKFPDVVIVLEGEGVRVNLVGNIDISKKGITSSTFASVPDAPISTFELSLPEGSHSVLTGNLPSKDKGNLCKAGALLMPTTLIAQNGAQIKQTTKIQVSDCPAARPAKRRSRKATVHKGRSASRRGGQR
jgi:hypothetical protein